MSLTVNSNSYSLFDTKEKPAENDSKDQNKWDQMHARRYGKNAAIWTVAAGNNVASSGSGHIY